MAFGDLFQFNQVFQSEKASINQRRRKTGRPDIELEPEAFADTPLAMSDGTTPLRPKKNPMWSACRCPAAVSVPRHFAWARCKRCGTPTF